MKSPKKLRTVDVENDEPRLSIETDAITRLFHFLDLEVNDWSIPEGDLAIRFVTEADCSQLHQQFFDDPEVTDVMTFPGDTEDEHAGDLAVCPAVAASACRDHQTSFAEEVTLYLIHGWLHLAGLDDKTESGVTQMRSAESLVMESIRQAGSLPSFEWADTGV